MSNNVGFPQVGVGAHKKKGLELVAAQNEVS
jgi:hypothetical protein